MKPTITDQYGRPMRRPPARDMEEEISGATTGGVRQITSGHPADGLTPARLGAILREAEIGDATAYLELAEQMEEKDLHYASVLGTRKRAIRKLNLVVEPGDEDDQAIEAAKLTRDALHGSAVKDDLVEMLDALGKGYSATEIVWNTGGPRWTIRRLEPRDPRWFRFDQTDGRTLLLRDLTGDLPLKPYRFIVHRARLKSGLPIRSGLARLAAWGYVFKNYTLKDWAIFMEAYGHPLRIGKHGPNATPEEKATLLRAVRRLGVDMAAVFPKSMEIELVNGNVTGAEKMFEGSARYWDEQLSKAVIGQTGTTDAIAGGHAVGKVHNEVREDIRDSDAEQLAATLEHCVAIPITKLNFGPEVAPPRIKFETEEERDDRMTLLAIKTFGPMGVPIAKKFVQQTFGIPEPAEGEELITFQAPQASPATPDVKQLASAHAGHIDAFRRIATEQVTSGIAQGHMDALLGDLLDALERVDNVDDARDLIALAMDQAPDDSIRELLARITFNGRVAGRIGADLT